MTDKQLANLKRESRAALNEARALVGLPPKLRIVRKLERDDPRVIELKERAGFTRHARAERR